LTSFSRGAVGDAGQVRIFADRTTNVHVWMPALGGLANTVEFLGRRDAGRYMLLPRG